jgi:hypothetical protein
VFLSQPIHYSAYKSLNNDFHKRLGIQETTPESTRQQEQQGQQFTQQQPTTGDIATMEFASPAELPCTVPIVHHIYGTNTAAERVGKSLIIRHFYK